MRADEWWKNFSLQAEVEVAGAFIYNGMRHFHIMRTLEDATGTFEVLYNVSIGVERLQKVAIILLEADSYASFQELERSLYGHDTVALADRIAKSTPVEWSRQERQFMTLLTNFYLRSRYGRFSAESAVDHLSSEVDLMMKFLAKNHIIKSQERGGFLVVQNDDRIKRFLGKVAKQIVDRIYGIIKEAARRQNIYTYELESTSKAGKVFLGERLDFLQEDVSRREALLFLMHPSTRSSQVDLIRHLEPLDLDAAMVPEYASFLILDSPSLASEVNSEVMTLYEELEDEEERIKELQLLDAEYLFLDSDPDAAP